MALGSIAKSFLRRPFCRLFYFGQTRSGTAKRFYIACAFRMRCILAVLSSAVWQATKRARTLGCRCAAFNLTEIDQPETHCPELEEDRVAGGGAAAGAGAASLIKIGHRGNAKLPVTSSITFTWQT